MQNNIYIELDLFLDPANTDATEMRTELETKIMQWNNKGDRFKDKVIKTKAYFATGLGDLRQQANEAREIILKELRKQVNIAKRAGVIEEQTKNIVNKFKKYFSEATILREIGVQTQESDFPPQQPSSLVLQCKKSVSYGEMETIAKDLEFVGKRNLYELLNLPTNAELSKLQAAAKSEADRIHKMPKGSYEADVLNRLGAKFIYYFKDSENRKSYDYALKRYPFDKLCKDELNIYALGFTKRQKTEWKIYQEAIRQTKQLEYNQAEAEWLVYEYFVVVNKCPVPVHEEVQRDDGGIFGHTPSTKKLSDEELFGAFLDNAVNGVFGQRSK